VSFLFCVFRLLQWYTLIMEIEEVGIKALQAAFAMHQSLGEGGKEDLQKNQFGDTAMKGDYQAEEAVLGVLKDYKTPVIVYSEEHGKVEITATPQLLGVLDGIDGSFWYKAAWGKGQYGTMFGIFTGTNPKYSDYIFGGVMEHATKWLFYGVKGKGAFILDLASGEKKQIHVSHCKSLTQETKIHIDQYWDINNEVFTSKLTEYNVMEYKRCSSFHYTNTAMGVADLTLECTRKGSLEIAAAYPIIMEAGGVMVSINGEPLGEKHYLEFGQDKHIPVITAATQELADDAVKFFN
jgi:fructose-1,6-bisphosphatase/inositol monophosphatase family enzyme